MEDDADLRMQVELLLEAGRFHQAWERIVPMMSESRVDGVPQLAARALLGLLRPLEAEQQAIAALRLEPTDGAALYVLVHARVMQHRHDDAVPVARALVRTWPSEWWAHAALASALSGSRLGRPKARDAARVAVELAPEEPGAHLALGEAAVAAEDYPLAAEAFVAALRLDPHNGVALSNLGLVRAQGGDEHAALKIYADAVSTDDGRVALPLLDDLVDKWLVACGASLLIALPYVGLTQYRHLSWLLPILAGIVVVAAPTALLLVLAQTTRQARRVLRRYPQRNPVTTTFVGLAAVPLVLLPVFGLIAPRLVVGAGVALFGVLCGAAVLLTGLVVFESRRASGRRSRP